MIRPRPFRLGPLLSGRLTSRNMTILIMCLLLLLGGGVFLRGRVISVADGDTLTVFTLDGGLTEVRLYGVDCPEFRQRGGEEADAATRALVFLEDIRLEVLDTDRYGRSVALVFLPDGRILNEEMVRQGRAWVYTAYCEHPRCTSWKALEQTARAEGRGLWRDRNPQPPWKWREKKRR